MTDTEWMRLALIEAKKAAALDEVPIGALVVHGNEQIAAAHNRVETLNDPTAHAEIIVIRQAVDILQTKWLDGCTLYTTLEPCAMCAGAIVLARLERVVFGAHDRKHGACGSLENLVQDARRNHRVLLMPGVLAAESQQLLSKFFKLKRTAKT